MRTRIFILTGVLFFVISACKNNPVHTEESNQGMVTYHVSYPDSVSYGLKSALFPKEIVLVFKGEKAVFIASAGLGMVQMVNLLDREKRSAVSLLIDNLRQNVGCRLTPEEIGENENSIRYTYDEKEEAKKIAGQDCHRILVKDLDSGKQFDLYASDRIRFYYWNSPFASRDHLFLEYTHTVNNLTMNLVATKVDLTTPVDTSLFEVKGNYRWMDQKDYFTYLSTL